MYMCVTRDMSPAGRAAGAARTVRHGHGAWLVPIGIRDGTDAPDQTAHARQAVGPADHADQSRDHETRTPCALIGESAEYVPNQLVESMLAKDKEFIACRAEHPDSYLPLPVRQRGK
jgi:hypothetical protein